MKKYAFIICVLCQSAVIGQNIIVVDNNPISSADYSNLQMAIDEAQAGDFIYIQPSITSYGDVNIGKQLHLRGLAHYPEVTNGVPAEVGRIQLVEDDDGLDPDGSSFSGLKITTLREEQNESFNNIHIFNCYLNTINTGRDTKGGANWIVAGNIFVRKNSGDIGINLIDASNGVNWIIHHNIFQEFPHNGAFQVSVVNGYNNTTQSFNNIYILKFQTSVAYLGSRINNFTFVNDIFLIMGPATSFGFAESQAVNYKNCVVHCYDGQDFNAINGTDNLVNINPEFTSLVNGSPEFNYENDYMLTESSGAKGAGTDGHDPGVYNGSYNFLQRGYAYDLPYISFIEVKNPGVAVGQTLNVEFKASGN